MALNAYLTLKGQKQGQIKGSVVQKGKENSIMVIAVNHSIISPRDAQSGLPTGKRAHRPFVITKELDKSSPLLYQALITNEKITEFTLKFWRISGLSTAGTGQEVQNYTVKLVNASISSIDFKMLNNKDPELVHFNELEEVAFTYEKISWTWNDGGITCEDTWNNII